MINRHVKLKVKFITVQKMLHSEKITQNFLSFKANLTLKVKVKVTSFRIVQDLLMINTQLKLESKISMIQKLLHSQGITQNFKV